MLKKLIIYIFLSLFIHSFSNANFDVKARTAILQDYYSGEILYEKEPDRSIYPASMTKIMTSIIAFEMLKNGDITLDDKFLVSEKANIHKIKNELILLSIYSVYSISLTSVNQ